MMDSHTSEARILAGVLTLLGWEFVTEPAMDMHGVEDECAMKGIDY